MAQASLLGRSRWPGVISLSMSSSTKTSRSQMFSLWSCLPTWIGPRLLSAGDSSISTRPWPRLASPPVRWCVRHPPGCCGPGVLERRVVWLSPVRVVGRPARVRNQMQQESRRTAYRAVLASPRQRPRRPQFSRRSARRQPRGAGRAVRPWPFRSVPVPGARRACSPPGRAGSMPRVCRQARLLVSRVCRPGARTPA